MTPTPSDVFVTDPAGRVVLPAGFANAAVRVERVSDDEVVIRRARDMDPEPTEEDDWPESKPMVLSPADWELFVTTLENPPPPNDALRNLLADMNSYKPVE